MKFLVWDVTCIYAIVDTFCSSCRSALAKEAGGTAAIAEREKARKYEHLDRSYSFQPIAVETCGSMTPDSLCFLRVTLAKG